MRYSDNPFGHVVDHVSKHELSQPTLDLPTIEERVEILYKNIAVIENGLIEGSPDSIVFGHVQVILSAMENLTIFKVREREAFDVAMVAVFKQLDVKPENYSNNVGRLSEIL